LRLSGLAGEVTLETGYFRIRRVDQEVLGVRRARVLEELGRNDGDGRSDVTEVGADVPANELLAL